MTNGALPAHLVFGIRHLKPERKKSYVWRTRNSIPDVFPAFWDADVCVLDLDAGGRGAEQRAGSKRKAGVDCGRGADAFFGRADLLFRGKIEAQAGCACLMNK